MHSFDGLAGLRVRELRAHADRGRSTGHRVHRPRGESHRGASHRRRGGGGTGSGLIVSCGLRVDRERNHEGAGACRRVAVVRGATGTRRVAEARAELLSGLYGLGAAGIRLLIGEVGL
ncbi:hypothetical protein C5613_35960 [Rhodococcus opacus]|uniref:Uncharacterized protein n=1 Tax=Rhodococcus opacus TaxID=37919 RepID=A0A2S8IP80_RHOOP|nr:hypothetical protein C5613_35960 [Rhodococcus opacus]